MKGCDIKKYYPVDFDEKGNVILGRERNTPTSNGFIPTTWVPGGGGEDDKPGIKSITITPEIETTPALGSLFPFYLDEAQAEDGWQSFDQVLAFGAALTDGTKYTVTVTPTSGWCVGRGHDRSGMGEPFTYKATVTGGTLTINPWVAAEDESKGINVLLTVTGGK